MRNRIVTAVAGIALLANLAGCALSGGQNLDPLMIVLMPKLKVLNFDAKTYIDAAAACNAVAAGDYNAAMTICSDPQGFVDGINNSGVGALVPSNAAASAVKAVGLLCKTRGFTTDKPATIEQTTCPVGGKLSPLATLQFN